VSFFTGMGFDGLVQATALAALHPTLPIYTGVYPLPLRHRGRREAAAGTGLTIPSPRRAAAYACAGRPDPQRRSR
jgi:hypothetical protein